MASVRPTEWARSIASSAGDGFTSGRNNASYGSIETAAEPKTQPVPWYEAARRSGVRRRGA